MRATRFFLGTIYKVFLTVPQRGDLKKDDDRNPTAIPAADMFIQRGRNCISGNMSALKLPKHDKRNFLFDFECTECFEFEPVIHKDGAFY